MNDDREKLLDSYLDGDLAPEQAAEFAALLEDDPGARANLLRFVLLETQLTEALLDCDEDRRVEELRESLGFAAVNHQDRRESGCSRPAAIRWRKSWLAVAGVAAALLMGIGVWSVLSKPSQAPHQVLAGRVLIDNDQSENPSDLPAGSAIQVVGDAPAELQLSDGSHVVFEPASRAVLHGKSGGMRQVVELVEGAGTFRVRKGGGRFRIKTSVGDVTVLGTEFSVGLLTSETEKGQSEMKKSIMMAVVVFSGLVQVDFDGKTYSLAAGDSRVFGARSDRPIFGDDIKTPVVGDNSYLVEMTEFFELTPEQQKAFPAAVIAYKKAVEDFSVEILIERQRQIHNDLKAGILDVKGSMAEQALLLFEYQQVHSGTGTLSEILTEKQKAEWGAFQHYCMVVPALEQKGIELTKDQLAAIRQKCNAAAKKLAGMDPGRRSVGLSVSTLLIDVRTNILTAEQRTELTASEAPGRAKKPRRNVTEEQTDKP